MQKLKKPDKQNKDRAFLKDREVNKNFDNLPKEEKDILKKAVNGLTFDNLNEAET